VSGRVRLRVMGQAFSTPDRRLHRAAYPSFRAASRWVIKWYRLPDNGGRGNLWGKRFARGGGRPLVDCWSRTNHLTEKDALETTAGATGGFGVQRVGDPRPVDVVDPGPSGWGFTARGRPYRAPGAAVLLWSKPV
jgi:hypothetical protein